MPATSTPGHMPQHPLASRQSQEHWQRAHCAAHSDLNSLQADGAFRCKAHLNTRALLLSSQEEAVIQNRYNLKF